MQENPYGIESLWQQGDLVIRTVAVVLLIMSIISWSIILVRAWRLFQQRRQMRELRVFWQAPSLGDGLQQLGPNDAHNIFHKLVEDGNAALYHHDKHNDALQDRLPLSEWLSTSLRGSIDEAAERMQAGLSILASIGATAPFVGLFGTVWGIYHALVNIGVSGQASIDKVAGPVGEALIMTAFGLAVAIPAVLGYNALVRGNKTMLGRLNRFAHKLHAYLLSGISPKRTGAKVSPLHPDSEVS